MQKKNVRNSVIPLISAIMILAIISAVVFVTSDIRLVDESNDNQLQREQRQIKEMINNIRQEAEQINSLKVSQGSSVKHQENNQK